jgi:hypothetical protein
MADYYPLIAKAVSGLDKNTGEARRALYERARTALVAQLRGVAPALSESEITRERLALEEAIRKVEAEAARKARFDPLPERRRTDRADANAQPKDMPREAPLPAKDSRRVDGEESAASPAPGAPPSVQSIPVGNLRRPVRKPAEQPPMPSAGLRGFRDVVAEAENLGEATAQAGKSAREAFASVPSPSPEFDRIEPHIEPEGLRPREARPAARARDPRRVERREPGVAREPALPRGPAPRERPVPRDGGPLAREAPPAEGDPENHAFPARDFAPAHGYGGRAGAPFPPEDEDPVPRALRRRPEPDEDGEGEELSAPLRSRGRLVLISLVILVLAALGGVTAWQWETVTGTVRGLMSPFKSAPSTLPQQTAPPPRQKSADRVPSSDSAQPAAAVAQRVVLYEEDPNDQAGKRYIGSALWRTETVTSGPDQPPETIVRADIEIPERKMTMKWSLRRNSDKTLPASHTVEIMFTLPPDFPHQGIQNIPGILMKQAEQTRGVPLAGLAVKVTTGYFLIGLSAVESDMQRNVQLLKERAWFDVPIVYADGRRAILAVEKGTPGERAFADAFAAWNQ